MFQQWVSSTHQMRSDLSCENSLSCENQSYLQTWLNIFVVDGTVGMGVQNFKLWISDLEYAIKSLKR